MARPDQFTGLTAFLAVAEHSSFRAAAAELGVTRAAVSQAVQALERRIGQPLFQRTTRSVALTEGGARLLAATGPASAEIALALERVAGDGGRPAGQLRLSAPRIAMDLAIAPVLAEFRDAYPEVTVEVDVDDTSVDLAPGRYDAGVRIGDFIERDMVAVRLTPDFQWLVVGSPGYFARRGQPTTPRDLMQHECIRYRFPTARSVYRWEFEDEGAAFSLEPPGGVTTSDHLLMVDFARRGVGLAYTADLIAGRALQSGELVPVLQAYLPSKPGLFLYFPANAQKQPKLRAFINTAKRVLGPRRRALASPVESEAP